MSVKRIFDYCDELIGADLLDEKSTKKLERVKSAAQKKMVELHSLLDELAGADLLPEGNEENGFENCEEIIDLFDF